MNIVLLQGRKRTGKGGALVTPGKTSKKSRVLPTLRVDFNSELNLVCTTVWPTSFVTEKA